MRDSLARVARWPLCAALGLAIGLALALAGTVSAHAFLVRTTPQTGERLVASPTEVGLWFSEPVEARWAEVTVRNTRGGTALVGPVEPLDGGARLRAGLPPLGEGIYVVTWRVLAADGHRSEGEFAFAVGTGGRLPAPTRTASGEVSWPDALASGLFVVGLALGIGGLASEAFVWGPVARRRSLAEPLAPAAYGLLLSLLGAALQLALLVGARAGSEAGGGADASPWVGALVTRPGLLTAAELAGIAYALWILQVRHLRVWGLLPLGGAVVAAAFRGHSGNSGEWWAAPVGALHLALAGFWVGALVHLVLVLRSLRDDKLRSALGEAAQRYAGLAQVAVPALLVAGVLTALAEFNEPAELLETAYGRVLLVKLFFVAIALGLALNARLRALPPKPERLGLLRRLTRAESAALLAVLGVSALLANAAPPRLSAAVEADLLGPAPLAGPVVRSAHLAGQLTVYLAAADGELQLRILEPGGDPAEDARVQIQGRDPSGKSLALYPRSCGRGCFTMSFAWPEGTTHLTTTVSSGTWTGGVAEFGVSWPPGPEEPELLDQVIRRMRGEREIVLTEQVSSGPGAATPPNTFRLTGPEFVAQELYAAGGASDVRRLPGEGKLAELSLDIRGSAVWYRLWIDPEHRLRRELIVNPGHRIERSFAYE